MYLIQMCAMDFLSHSSSFQFAVTAWCPRSQGELLGLPALPQKTALRSTWVSGILGALVAIGGYQRETEGAGIVGISLVKIEA